MTRREAWLTVAACVGVAVIAVYEAQQPDASVPSISVDTSVVVSPFVPLSSPVATPTPTPPIDYQNTWPDAHIAVTSCVNTGAYGKDLVVSRGIVARVAGTLTNADVTAMDYIVSINANGTGFSLGTGSVQLNRVQPGQTVSWATRAVVSNSYPGQQLACSVLAVNAQS